MQVHVKFFAIFREYVGLKEDWREIEPGTTVQELWNYYTANAKNPRVANIRAAFSVNQRLAKPETVLQGGEEVGFLPPVSGGAGKRPERLPKLAPRPPQKKSATRQGKKGRYKHPPRAQGKKPTAGTTQYPPPGMSRDFLVTAKPLSTDALIARVAHPGAGGIAVFLGVVRDNANDRDVKFLEYEAYPEMAERVLEQIGAETLERWGDVRLAIAHRTGRLQIGEASVIIAASAPHRAEAFSACRYAIERLKVVLPVWKREFVSDTDYWVEGPTAGETPTDKADEVVGRQESAVLSV
jgi:molybdopterin synthase catalytic subunit